MFCDKYIKDLESIQDFETLFGGFSLELNRRSQEMLMEGEGEINPPEKQQKLVAKSNLKFIKF